MPVQDRAKSSGSSQLSILSGFRPSKIAGRECPAISFLLHGYLNLVASELLRAFVEAEGLRVYNASMIALKYKLVVYVPVKNADAVREAIGNAGGGKSGKYSFCSFSTKGTGRFKPEKGAQPAIGKVGELTSVEEERIEVTLDKDIVGNVIAAIKRVHPYEEIAYDLYPLEVWER